jgi:hypothetical protein
VVGSAGRGRGAGYPAQADGTRRKRTIARRASAIGGIAVVAGGESDSLLLAESGYRVALLTEAGRATIRFSWYVASRRLFTFGDEGSRDAD